MADRRIRTAGRILGEIGIIVLSVLLALGANEWRQAAARTATVNTVRETMRSEAVANRAQVQRALDHHTSLIRQLRTGGIELTRLSIRGEGIDTTSTTRFAATLRAAALRQGAPLHQQLLASRTQDGGWRVEHGTEIYNVRAAEDTLVIRGTGNISLQPPFLIDAAWETAQVTQAAVHMDPEILTALARVRQLSRQLDLTVSRLIDILYGARGGGDILSALQDLAMFEMNLIQAYDDLLARL